MSVDENIVVEIIRDLKVDTAEIKDVHKLLTLKRDKKWAIRLLLLSYLLRGDDFVKISDFVKFAFSTGQDSLYRIFLDSARAQQELKIPLELFPEGKDRLSLQGSENARSTPSRRSDLFVKIEEGYLLNDKTKSRKLAVVLFIALLKANEIDVSKFPDYLTGEITKSEKEQFRKLHLLDYDGKPAPIVKEIGETISKCPYLLQDAKQDDLEANTVFSHIESILLETLDSHSNAFRIKPYRKDKQIVFEPIYELSISSEGIIFDFENWLSGFIISDNEKDSESDEIETKSKINPPVIVIGGAGSGKSFWTIQTAINLLNKSSRTSSKSEGHEWIPVTINNGAIRLNKKPQGEILIYGDQGQELWYQQDEPDFISRKALIDRSISAMLTTRSASTYIRKKLHNFDWKSKKFVLILDAWDELGSVEKREMIKFVAACGMNSIPCIITSRVADDYLSKLDADYYIITEPSIDSCKNYLEFRGMEQGEIDEIHNWFPNISPLDLEILGLFPKMEEIAKGRVPVYRTWIETQLLLAAGIQLPHELNTRSQLDFIVESEFFKDKPLIKWLRDRSNIHSAWNYLPFLANLQQIGKHVSLNYHQVLEENSLLRDMIRKQTGSSDYPHPEIIRNHLLPYLSAEYVFRDYLKGHYRSLHGDSQSLEFLTEILKYDSERRHENELIEGSVELTPFELASMICLESASSVTLSSSNSSHIFLPTGDNFRPMPFYAALFHTFVNYWKNSQSSNDRRTILEAFSKMLQRNIIEKSLDDPAEYLIPILEMESSNKGVTYSELIANQPISESDIPVLDKSGYLKHYLDFNKTQDALIGLLLTNPRLTPWILRLIKEEYYNQIIDATNTLPEDEIILDVFDFIFSRVSEKPEKWFGDLENHANRLESSLLWNFLASRTFTKFDDIVQSNFTRIIDVLNSKYVNDDEKYRIITQLRRTRLSPSQLNEIGKLTARGQIDTKYGIAMCILHEIPDIELDTIFDVISESDGLGWLHLILPGILKEQYNEEHVNKQFCKLSLGTMKLVSHVRVNPWDEERFNELKMLWWKTNLQTVDDAMKIIQAIRKTSPRGKQFARLDYRETRILERLVDWLKKSSIKMQKEFFETLIISHIDMTDIAVRRYFDPIYSGIKTREKIDDLLVEMYPSHLQGFQPLPISRKSWMKHIDKVSRDEILEWGALMDIYLDAGQITSIEEAIDLVKEIEEQTGELIETFNSIVKWVLQRSEEDITKFTLSLLGRKTDSKSRGHWNEIRNSGLLEALSPVKETSPKVYERVLQIVTEFVDQTIRTNSYIRFLFDIVTYEDQMKIIRPHIRRYLRESFIFHETNIAELIIIHGNKKDVEILVESLNSNPRPLGKTWLKDMEKSKLISKSLTNPLAKLFYEMDLEGGWDEYKKLLTKHPTKAEKNLLVFLENEIFYYGFDYLSSESTLREIGLKYWKDIFLTQKIRSAEREIYLGRLYQDDNVEILKFIGSELDRIHRRLEKRNKKEDKQYRLPWYNWTSQPLSEISKKHGYQGLHTLLAYIKEPYAIEGVMTFLVAAAQKEGIPKSEIESYKELQKISKETRYRLLENYEKVEDSR